MEGDEQDIYVMVWSALAMISHKEMIIRKNNNGETNYVADDGNYLAYKKDVKLFDSQNKLIADSANTHSEKDNPTFVFVEKLPKGKYFVHVEIQFTYSLNKDFPFNLAFLAKSMKIIDVIPNPS